MNNITIKNDLNNDYLVYDSFEQEGADQNYYGTLQKLGDAKADETTSITPLHAAVNTLVLFDSEQKPVARFVSMLGNNNFEVSEATINAMAEATAFVDFIGKNPDSAEAKAIKALKNASDMDSYFKTLSDYSLVTADIYMMALIYKAAHPDTVKKPPEERTYSLSMLVSYLSGTAYPAGMPDILVRQVFFNEKDNIFVFGGKVRLADMPFKDNAIAGIIGSLLPTDKDLNVRLMFDLQVGLNTGFTKIEFYYNELDIPLGKNHQLAIHKPDLTLTINPLFKFVTLEVSADYPFSLFGNQYDTKLSMVIDNIEVEVGFDLQGSQNALPAPPVMRGIHFDEFGIGMGLVFEPPGYALGVSGKFHIGEGSNIVSLDDDQFAMILDLEGEVPNPVYLSFYVPEFDLDTLLTVFTDISLPIDLPVKFSDLSFVWNENPLEPYALPDGSMSTGGYGFSGYMDLFGLGFYADIDIEMTKFTGTACMDPFSLGDVLKLSGDGKAVTIKVDASGNPIRNNVVPKTAAEREAIKNATSKTLINPGGPEITISTEGSPYFTMDAKASLLGLINEEIKGRIDNSGISFELDYGSLIQSKMSCQLKTSGSFSGAFSFGPDLHVPLPGPLGSIHLVATISAQLGLALSDKDLDFSVGGGFNFEGIDMNFGPASLDVQISSITGVIEAIGKTIVDDAADIFEALLKDAMKWATLAFKGAVTGVENIASGLASHFKQAINDASKILNDIGMPVDQASKALKAAYNATAQELAAALKFGFNIEGQAVAVLLKGLDYSADEIGGVLHSIFGINGQAAAQVMKDIGIPAQQITQVLKDVFSLSPNVISDYLKAVGFPAQMIADVFKAIGGPFTTIGNGIQEALDEATHYVNPSNW